MAAPAHDNEYLKASVGPALVQALTSMVVTQPPDAVDYLGNYLIAYVEREEGKAKQAARFKELDAAVEIIAAEEAAAAKAAAAAEEAKKPSAEETALKTSLATSTEIAELYPDVLAHCKTATGATAVYLGKKETDKTEVPVISFLNATEGCDMAGKALKGATEGDEEATPDGVTFTLFKKLDVPEEEEPPPEEEGAPPPPPKPEPYLDQLLIENVLRPPDGVSHRSSSDRLASVPRSRVCRARSRHARANLVDRSLCVEPPRHPAGEPWAVALAPRPATRRGARRAIARAADS